MIFRHLLNMRSHPTWVRGLKHSEQQNGYTENSRTLRGCVDRNILHLIVPLWN